MIQHKYNSTIILDTRGSEESVDGLIESIKKDVAAVQGKVTSANNDGVRNFARVTNPKFVGSTYVSLTMEGPSTLPAALRERFRLNKTIYRLFVERAA